MQLENKFLFLGKTFVVIFIIINCINLFPIQFTDIFYYTNFLTILLDTTTLLLLGSSIPTFLYLRKKKLLLVSNTKRVEETESISLEIDKLEEKQFRNYKINKYFSIFFLIIALIQPINLIFILNRSDIYIGNIINIKNQSLEAKKSQILKMLDENSNTDLSDELFLEKKERSQEIIKNLEKNSKLEIDRILKNNNSSKFREIKFIIRNIFMSLVWSFSFLKLSKIHCGE